MGLEDTSKYPHLFAELLRQGWTEDDLEKVAGRNLLRVLRYVEQVRDEMATCGQNPHDELMPRSALDAVQMQCVSPS